jgi:hypothetical protein
MNPVDEFPLVLHKTYYHNGFFNLRVDYDHLVRKDDGPVVIVLPGEGGFEGRVGRSANSNGTARIFGGARLRAWFVAHFKVGDTVTVEFASPTLLRMRL